MKPLGKIIGLVLLLTTAAPMVMAYGPAQIAQQKPAGCHEHERKSPVPEPATYQCCQAAHQVAAVREAVRVRTGFVAVSRVIEFASGSLPPVVCPPSLKLLVFGSPGITSLRI